MSNNKLFLTPKNMPNVTIRETNGISNTTSKLAKPKYLQRTVSTISLNGNENRNINYQKKIRKSASLQDLSPANKKCLNLKRRLFYQMENQQNQLSTSMGSPPLCDERNKMLAMKVYAAFLKNVWKKVAKRSSIQMSSILTLDYQVKNATRQISTLKSFLESDEQFRKGWVQELGKLRKNCKLLIDERDDLRNDNFHLESELERLKQDFHLKTVELLNERNTLLQVRSDANCLEVQLEKEREKVKELRNQLKKSNEKETLLKEQLKSRMNDLNIQSKVATRKEEKINSELDILKKSNEEWSQQCQNLNEENEKMRKLQKDLEISRINLIKEKTCLKKELDEKTERCKSLERISKQQTLPLIELKTAVMTLEAETFSSKFVSLASTVIKFPLALLKTASYS